MLLKKKIKNLIYDLTDCVNSLFTNIYTVRKIINVFPIFDVVSEQEQKQYAKGSL